MIKKTFILAIASILMVACTNPDQLKLEQLEQDLKDLQNSDVATVPEAEEVTVPEDSPYAFSFEKSRYGVDAGGSVSVAYTLPVASTVEVAVKDGWSATVTPSSDTEGVIVVTAPDPASPTELVVKASTDAGLTTVSELPVMVRDPYTDATRTDVRAMAYYGFSNELATDENFKMMVDAGVTMISIESVDNYHEQLDLCAKYGAQGVLFVNGPAGDYYRDHSNTKLENIIAEVKNHPALAAYQIFDEPSTVNINQIVIEKNRIEELDPEHPVYVNLHPGSASEASLGVEDYFEYVETFVTECNLKFITFDQYPIFQGYIDPSWHRSLAAVYTSSKKHNIPFWAFALCCQEWYREIPTLENTRLQCNTNLAFGAQVNQFFVWRATSGTNLAPLCPKLDENGNRIVENGHYIWGYSSMYDVCKAYCTEMHNRGFVFADCNVTKVRNSQVISSWLQNVSVYDLPPQLSSIYTSREAIVSFIENQGNEYIVIVNSSWQLPQTVSFELTDMIYMIDRNGVFTELEPGIHRELALDPGDMMVLKVK